MQQKIELLKVRDFGEIITDTFVFIRQNFKPLLTCFFVFCGLLLVAGGVLSALQQVKTLGQFNNFSIFQSRTMMQRHSAFDFLGPEYFITLFVLWTNSVIMQVTVISYMSLYKEKGNVVPSVTEVWGYIKQFLPQIWLVSLLLGIMISIAFAFCLVPGFYFLPIFGLIFPIMIFEKRGFGFAFNQSFKLISGNWWLTFGCLVVMGLIVYVASIVVLAPASIFQGISLVTHAMAGHGQVSIALTIITTVLSVLVHIFYILVIVTIVLCYTNIKEEKEATGLMGRISQIGNNTIEDETPAGEY